MTISPWLCLLATVPVLFLGEAIIRRIRVLAAFSIPAAVVGGLLISIAVLTYNLLVSHPIAIDTKIAAKWWTWLITPEPEWFSGPAQPIHQPLIVAFFTCVGLNASWRIAKQGSWQLLLFCVVAGALAVLQNVVGAGLAMALHQPPLMGVVCGAVALTGGHGTAIGFTEAFEKAGYAPAAAVGAAAATFGIIAGSLLGGPLATLIIRRHHIVCSSTAGMEIAGTSKEATSSKPQFSSRFVSELVAMRGFGGPALINIVVLLICIKLGAWVSYGLRLAGLTFPVHIGAMTVGIIVRNLFDLSGKPIIRTDILTVIASLLLSVFLAFAMISLNLASLLSAAVPMLVILIAQTLLMLLFAYAVTFTVMGRSYEAAVITGGHIGFGLGVTSNAIASMDSLTDRFGPSPRAFLVVVLVGAYLNDFTNALNITWFLNFLR